MPSRTAGRGRRKVPARVKAVVARQRAIQRKVARSDRKHPRKEAKRAMQAGARRYPEPPLPRQHERKPGAEHAIEPAPMYEAPFYLGSSKLFGKVALITGADSGIGRAVAVLFAREGANVAIQYLCEQADAETTRAAVEAEGRRAILIPGRRQQPDILCRSSPANRRRVRQARHPRQQRRVPGACRTAGGPD